MKELPNDRIDTEYIAVATDGVIDSMSRYDMYSFLPGEDLTKPEYAAWLISDGMYGDLLMMPTEAEYVAFLNACDNDERIDQVNSY